MWITFFSCFTLLNYTIEISIKAEKIANFMNFLSGFVSRELLGLIVDLFLN